jgi:hypothetical protein
LHPELLFNFEDLKRQIRNNGIPEEITKPANSLGAVEFEQQTNKPTEASLKQIETNWKKKFPQGIPDSIQTRFFSISRKEVTDEDQKRNVTQTQTIQKALLPQAQIEEMKNGATTFPTKDSGLTLAVRVQIIG